jgi:xanthine dehydrogenase molybdenum-binding subunit
MKNHVVGERITRQDGAAKVTGSAPFIVDLKMRGMLHAKVLRSPHPHAKIFRIDTRKALEVPGVRAVACHENGRGHLYSGGAGPLSTVRDMRIFDRIVRFVGDGVAAVAAVSEEVAKEALGRIEVEYELLPAVFDPEEAMRPGAPQLHGDISHNAYGGEIKNNVARSIAVEQGNLEEGFGKARVVKEGVFRTSRVQHCTLEPHACVASWDPDGRLYVWSSTQSPFGCRAELGEALGIPESRISVAHFGHVGGSFGGKMDSYQRETVCAVLSRMTGAPVRLEYTREEEFANSITRHPVVISIRMGCDAEGLFTALDFTAVADTGAYGSDGPAVLGLVVGPPVALYKIPHHRLKGYCVYTNHPVAGAFRGYGNPQGMFAIESIIDDLASELGMDPVEIRLKNAVRKGDPNKLAPGKTLLTCGLKECMEEGARAVGWKSRVPLSAKKGSLVKGLGMACMMHNSGTGGTGRKPEHAAAYVKMNGDGSLSLSVGVSDTGQGNVTALAQIAAEEMGLSMDRVIVSSRVDTDTSPFDLGTYASKAVYVAGSAVREAVRLVKRQIFEVAAPLLESSPEELAVVAGTISVRGAVQRRIDLGELIRTKEQANQGGRSFLAACNFTHDHNAPSFGAQFAEVEVNTETGQVRVNRVVAVHDVGRVINPTFAEGQLQGALQQGLGYALTEEMKTDGRGRVTNPSFADYKIWTVLDMPPLEILFLGEDDPTGPFGAKGVAEPGLVPTAAAIANAIFNATGLRIRELPMNPERVLSALLRQRQSLGG